MTHHRIVNFTVHQQDFGTAIDYLQQSEAILRRIGSPDAETVARMLQWAMGDGEVRMMN